MIEHVVVVDEKNNPIGTVPKSEVHGKETVLHRGFSVFVFDLKGNFLIQQRSAKKITWPLVWSNSCCGHPQLNETTCEAMTRRLDNELGIQDCELHEIIPDFRYKAIYQGVMENEFCPVWAAWNDCEPVLNKLEVENVAWISWEHFINEIHKDGEHEFSHFSYWSLKESQLLASSSKFQRLWNEKVK